MVQGISQSMARRLAVLAGLFATLCVSLALFAPSASASEYCGGWLGAYGQCYGNARSLNGVSGYGEQHSVCVGIEAIGRVCSGGPGQIATYNFGSTVYYRPRIENNAAGNNLVHGNTF